MQISYLLTWLKSQKRQLPINFEVVQRESQLLTKFLHYQQPSYLAEILQKHIPSRSLRSSGSTTISALLRKTYLRYLWNHSPQLHPAFGTNCLAIRHLFRLSRFTKNILNTTFFSRPIMALSLQPSQLFSPVASYRPQSTQRIPAQRLR